MKNANPELAIATESDRTAALTTILAILLHDLNNPLGIAKQTTDWALENADDPEQVRDGLQDTKSSLETVDKILKFARAYKKGEELDTEELGVWNLYRFLQDCGVSRDLVKVEGNESLLLHTSKYGFGILVMNLAKNGIEASDENVPITLSIEDIDGRMVFTVGDSGSGMTPKQVAEYGQLESTKQDTQLIHGLGNRIVLDLVKTLSIEMKVESELGKGSKFRLTLPKLES
jgi:signal transduction histidine kinase